MANVPQYLFELLVESVRDYAIFLLDPQGRIVSWNTGARLIKGYAPEEIIGRHFSVFYMKEQVERGWPEHELRVATREGRFEDEGWRVRKDGSRFWANVLITALRDENGELLGFSKVTRDLSERRAHEERLRESEERFRLLVDGVLDYAIYMLDPDGMVASWNPGAQRMKGYTRGEIIGRHISRFYVPEDVEAGKPWHDIAEARRTGRSAVEGWRLRKNGERFWVRTVLTTVYDSGGTIRGFAKVTQDLSQRRHVEALENAAERVNEFIATVAHELRNPLAPIRTAVAILDQSGLTGENYEVARSIIDRQSQHLSRIVDDLIDISRISSGGFAIRKERVELSDVVEAAVEAARPGIQSKGQVLQVETAPQPIAFDGDAMRLTQALTNLLSNAARYTPPGGTITLKTRQGEDHIVVSVRDTGRGLSPGNIERIFDMFAQVEPLPGEVTAGLGVGLALTRRIVDLHGGSVVAASEGEGRGAEFTIRLPSRQGMAAQRPVDRFDALSAGLPARRVLVVDDNFDAASMLDILLRSLGHITHVSHDGLEAIKDAETFRPEVVLLDIGLPGISGYEVARRIRAARPNNPPVIVAVTGWGKPEDRDRSREAGFDLHLVKPVNETDLLRALSAGPANGATLH
jgi:PAS domain S-box-containing protein